MKIFSSQNVFDAALDRIRYLFDEFENVVVGYSGGKDSTIILNLALQVAKEKDRLPLPVLFIDQEAEWQGTIDMVKKVMYNKDVKPYWFQIPMVMTNNASSFERYSYIWKEGEEDKFIHPLDPISIKENKYNTERFHELFAAIFKGEFKGIKSCYISGVRTEESPKRLMSLTHNITYKWITWGKILDKAYEHYTFYPIYDWNYTDVWKAIENNGWEYNRIYDEMYRHGNTITEMRISNLHHETAIQSLLLVQEIEPETWQKLSNRIQGANTIKHLKFDSFVCPETLPSMFESWEEYALHLSDTIIQEQSNRDALKKKIDSCKDIYTGDEISRVFYRTIINTILSSDWDFTKIANFEIRQETNSYRQYKKGVYKREMIRYSKYLTTDEQIHLIDEIEKSTRS